MTPCVYRDFVVRSLRRNAPPSGHVLPILTRQGEACALSPGPMPLPRTKPVFPDDDPALDVLGVPPNDFARRLHELASQCLMQADFRLIKPALVDLIAAEMRSCTRDDFRPRSGSAVAIWVHLGADAPLYTIAGEGIARMILKGPAHD